MSQTNGTPTTIRRKNPRQQGRIGVGSAIDWFTRAGYAVFLPIADAQRYDLVVDDGGGPLRVEVKTTTFRNPRGRFMVHLATNGGNQSWTGLVRRFDPSAADLLYVLTDSGDEYVIPTQRIKARTSLTLSPDLASHRVRTQTPRSEQLILLDEPQTG